MQTLLMTEERHIRQQPFKTHPQHRSDILWPSLLPVHLIFGSQRGETAHWCPDIRTPHREKHSFISDLSSIFATAQTESMWLLHISKSTLLCLLSHCGLFQFIVHIIGEIHSSGCTHQLSADEHHVQLVGVHVVASTMGVLSQMCIKVGQSRRIRA